MVIQPIGALVIAIELDVVSVGGEALHGMCFLDKADHRT